MIIYHGSHEVIKNPKAKGSNPENDYGPSFYCTLDLEQAKAWACKKDKLGFVSKYSMPNHLYQSLKILDLTNEKKFSILNWLAILMHFRRLTDNFKKRGEYSLKWLEKYYIDVSQYDVVIGYRADDRYFSFPLNFIDNRLSVEDLKKIFKLGDLGVQHAFMSEKAVRHLKFEGIIDCEEKYLGVYETRVNAANKILDSLIAQNVSPNKTYILDLMRKDNE